MNLPVLNGSYSFLGVLGFVAGYEHISECMADENFRSAARALMLRDQAPTLRTKGVDLEAYADSLIARYENRAIKHRTYQIATDGTQKLPQRLLDSVRWHLRNGSSCDYLMLAVAAWMRYVSGVDEQGQAIEIRDPLKEQLASIVAHSDEGAQRVEALLRLQAVFGDDLRYQTAFVSRVTELYKQLNTQGARATVAALVAQV